MRLLSVILLSLFVSCAAPGEENEISTQVTAGMSIRMEEGKVVKSIRGVEGNNVFIDFTDGSSLHLRSYKYPIKIISTNAIKLQH